MNVPPQIQFASSPTTDPWSYRPVDGHYDEMLEASGELRPAFKPLVRQIEQLGPDDLARRWEQAQRLIHENGVTYNVYGDPRGMDRPWQLDALPFVLSPEEWSGIEAAVIQRATLLNAILRDLYGPQTLLREGGLPPEIVFGQPGFLRPLHGLPVPGQTHLHLYAVDLARAPSGQWWVINDRTQAPSGSGYALENRLVTSRTLPDVFRESRVKRLAQYFSSLRDTMLAITPNRRENPRIVLLTPGPYNETYFEHAYLARYLGYPLVEGGDLTVRDERVYLKTLSGLLPVDVILRRLDDAYMDPLELREDSMLGVPGLVQAVRAGNVAIANALGSGLVETPAIVGFLPGLAQFLLGEDLHMPSVATWWCGQPEPLQYVKDHLNELVIKGAFPSQHFKPVFGNELSVSARKSLLARIEARPWQYVAQECVELSTAPAWVNKSLQPRHIMLRVFAVASGDTYHVMPGGLTRISGARDSLLVSTQSGGGSKDTWIRSDDPVSNLSLMRTGTTAVALSRAGFVLPSRVADNLFWLGRYVERVESTVRLVRAVLQRLNDESIGSEKGVLNGLIDVLKSQGRPVDDLATESFEDDLENAASPATTLVFDDESPGSVISEIHRVHHLAWLVRDRIAVDAWRILSQLDDDFVRPDVAPPLQLSSTLDLLDQAIMTLAAFAGQQSESMTREKGWHFLDIGRRIERAINSVALLRYGLGKPDEHESLRLETLLEIADSHMTYRSRYLSTVQAAPVLDLLLLDESNPRSVAFQLIALREHVEKLPREPDLSRRPPEQRLVIGMLNDVQLAEIELLQKIDTKNRRMNLEKLLNTLSLRLPDLSITLSRTYLSHTQKAHRLAGLRADLPEVIA